MKYFKDKNTGEVYAYDQEQIDGGLVKEGLVQMTDEEVSAHIAPPKIDPLIAIAARRYEAETAGTSVEGMPVNTERDSQALLTGAALQAMLDPNYTVRWKTEHGFVDLEAQQIIGLATAVRAHVQACFDREAELLEHLGAGTFDESILAEGWPDGQVSAPA